MRPDARFELRVVGGTRFLTELRAAAQVPLWQQMLPATTTELAAFWADLPDNLTLREGSTLFVLEIGGTVVVGAESESDVLGVPSLDGVVALSESDELAQQVLPWLAQTMRETHKVGVRARVSTDIVRERLIQAHGFVDQQVAYVEDPTWQMPVLLISDLLRNSAERAAALDASFRITDEAPEMQVTLGTCVASGVTLNGNLPQRTAAAWQHGGHWSGAGFDGSPFAWGPTESGDSMSVAAELLSLIPCEECRLLRNASTWEWGNVAERAMDAAEWDEGLVAEDWALLNPIPTRRLVDHIAGSPPRPRTWWRSGSPPLVIGWTGCEEGITSTIRVHSPRALGLLYVAATRHLH